jgi:hypothetical protein
LGAFLYRLEQEDGTPADPPTFRLPLSTAYDQPGPGLYQP